MDLLFALLPFFAAGFAAAVVAKATGINLSMCMLLITLYMGATPEQAIVIMLTFNTYTYFTAYSQVHRFSFKDFTFFPGFKIIIPMVITIAAIAFQPFIGITLFVGIFLLEIFAMIYKKMDEAVRPDVKTLAQMSAVASVLTTLGVFLVQFFPAQWYFVFAGLVMVGYVFLMWKGGKRNALQDVWDKLLYGAAFVTGLSGIDATDWLQAQHRQTQSKLSRCYAIVINTAMVVALMVSYGVLHYFSMGALFMTIGAALGIRFFGVTTYTGKGKFNYLTLGLTILAILIFFLVQPAPTGFPLLPEEFNIDQPF
jgi:uncharacterized membrane protein YfcA